MAISFPTNPTVNQPYVYNGNTYTWSGARWEVAKTSTAIATVSEETPSTAVTGNLWFDPETAVLSVYNSAWVDTGGNAGGGSSSAGGANTQIQFNNAGALGGSSSLTWDGIYLNANRFKSTSLTATRVVYIGANGVLQDSANLTFDGTALAANSINVSTLTVGRVTYAGTSGLLNDSANLSFDGTNLQIGNAGGLRFANTGNTYYVALKGSASTVANTTWTLPAADGTNNQYLQTDGAGNLAWATVDALPAQTGNSGKYLTTDGTTASWGTVSSFTASKAYTMSILFGGS
jgi:hypothetical protein